MLLFIDVNRLFEANKITLLKWSENSSNLRPIENFCSVLKNKVAETLLPKILALIKAIKLGSKSVKYPKNFAKT